MKKTYSKKQLAKMTTIIGTVFQCTQCKEGRFIAGSRGMEPLVNRVMKHMESERHGMFVPINPKPGMVYVGLPKMAYKKGDDPREWYDSIVAAGGRVPKWELKG